VEVTDEATSKVTTKYFTMDASDTQSAIDANVEFIFKEDLSDLVGSYITMPAQGTSDDQGIFKGQFSVKHNDLINVVSFDFYIQDQDVYQK
jgi:hypothetical protein